MPEVAIPGYTVFNSIRHQSPDDWRYMHNYLKPNIQYDGVRILGMGNENLAVENVEDENKVVAYSLNGYAPEDAITIFHTHRVLNTVFEHNFPRIHAAIAGRPMYPPFGGTIREKVVASDTDVKYPFSEVDKRMRSIGVPFTSEPHSKNIVVGDDGGEYYVDIIKPAWVPWTLDHINNITQDMEQTGMYTDEDLKIVEMSGKRIYEVVNFGIRKSA